ncbi:MULTISPECIES: ATP-dependent DNA helicase RecG [unclassified Acidovorax]|uniref:ATP-dependent DNA helicase RecG n=1 Tax=unclassified Acidovorax TaxID=2684926 RepID=UPI000BDACD2B|nr:MULTISPECIES: ATP-dependent DNA helicase RecG [unclassified Acidovorax]HQS21663.1 ATP-dependent DNA helicase RecG [Acidovorax defluvii]OYY27179.1 MAG: ATP-dependent DNA helicase RecG [Acidovorax sp. 35-64-16]OYY87574.1 MAG: ATP-dependent DNA helicase RecG [Acidovorax sp. 28-64-14]OYZ68134.1 MAG: ATP-dependent DNA helicase RecG [Acidovorax sp. 24-64-9]OZA70758.1 MAG: ATP-dependent DNA helicase RecG [Acidovorax sp. 39-64-12]
MPAAPKIVPRAAAPAPALSAAKGGASVAQKALQKLGLRRDIDLALHLPLRYEDETRITPLANARDGQMVQIEATVTASEIQLRPRRQLLVQVEDDTGSCELRFFSFYPSHQKTLAVGARLRIRGEVKGGFWGRQMMHPAFRVAGGELPAALTPVYPTTAGLPQPYLRRAVVGALSRVDLSDTLPSGCEPPVTQVYSQNGLQRLFSLREALTFLHHPTPDVALSTLEDHSHPAWQRLKAEELLAQQLSQQQSRRARDMLRAPVLRAQKAADGALPLHEQLMAVLPFSLTSAQRRVGEEIAADLARAVPMHRLLQGDVGSGKTVVSALAACLAMDAGWQCALMAPTEILAEQHFAKMIGWLEPLLAARGRRVAWLVGGQKKKERTAMLALVASGEAALVVGTHAVIQEQVQFKNLALAIIDEQHRFGVAQRLALRQKLAAGVAAGPPQGDTAPSGGSDPRSGGAWGPVVAMEPHMLMMSATPIPRTLAMSYYADLDVSVIDELPPGRTPIVTKLIADSRKDEVIARIGAQVAAGRQVYWVCPLIEESEALDLSNATATHADLSEALPGVMVGLLHSRMPTAEKKAVMALFTSGQMGVLVSTTVIEVGVDVPNASLMVIEHAERFGLSQLHQLRGRVGRGAAASACVLLYATNDSGRVGETAKERLRAMAETNDGFEIARRDLEIRGPGEFLGARQSGDALLRFADLATDTHLLEWARELAPQMLDRHPELAARHVARWLGGKSDYLKA